MAVPPTSEQGGVSPLKPPAGLSVRGAVQLLLRVVKIWQIWYLASTEAVKGVCVQAVGVCGHASASTLWVLLAVHSWHNPALLAAAAVCQQQAL